MNEQKNNGRGVFYGVIGIATLVVAIIGATFAYFTATASVNNVITGNMATITFELDIDKVTEVDEEKNGMIPMSNSMVEAAVASSKGACVDDNGNAVCQVYKATVTNTGSASLYLDGYVTLFGGSGFATDATGKWVNITDEEDTPTRTTMRWAQVFVSGDNYTTIGKTTTGATKPGTDDVKGITTNWDTLAATDAAATEGDKTGNKINADYRHNVANIKNSFAEVTAKGVFGTSANQYDIISRNYIRISDHVADAPYTRTTDVTSALVFNQYLDAAGGANDSVEIYFVVWLSETGTNQTSGSDGAGAFNGTDLNEDTKVDENELGKRFFRGDVVFNSAQGSEVTATFSGFAAVKSNNAA